MKNTFRKLVRGVCSIPFTVLLCTSLAIGPFLGFFVPLDSHHNAQRILQAVLFLLTPCFVLFHVARSPFPRPIISWPSATAGSIFFLLGLLSSTLAYSPRYALHEWATILMLVLAAWVVALEVVSTRGATINRLLILSGLICAFYLFNLLTRYGAALVLGAPPRPDDFIFGYDNYRFFNHVQTISLPLLCTLLLRSDSLKAWRWTQFWFVVTSLWWAMLFFSAGRGTFIGVLAGGAFAFALQRGIAVRWCSALLLTCLAGLGTHFVLFIFLPTLLQLETFGLSEQVIARSIASPGSGRGPLWALAWGLTIERPWLGVGPLHFAYHAKSLQIAAHPHNWVLQILAEWGLPALIALIAFVGTIFRALSITRGHIREGDSLAQVTLVGWLATGGAILIDGLVSGLIVMPTSQLWIVLVAGCAWGWTSTLRQLTDHHPPQILKRPLRLIIVGATAPFVIAVYWNGVYPEVLNPTEYEKTEANQESYSRRYLLPRIWRAGFF